MWKKHGLFRQFLFSYICVLIPMLALSLWQLGELRDSYAQKWREQTRMRMSYALERMDEQASEYEKQSVMLANEQEMLRYRVLGSVQNTKVGIERLQEVLHGNTQAHDVFMCYGGDRVYAARGMSRMSVYLGDTLRLNAARAEAALECIESDEIRVMRLPSEGNDVWVLYHYPVRIYKGGETASVNFLLNEDELIHSVEQMLADEQFCFALSTADGEASVWSCSEGRRIQAMPEGCERLDAQGAFFSLTVGFDRNAMATAGAARWLLGYALLAATTLALLALSVQMSQRHYRPVVQLVRQTDSLSRAGAPERIGDEYEYIGSQLRQIVEESSRLSRQLAREQREVRRQSATMIFNGIFSSRAEILSRMSFAGIALEADYFAVLAFSVPDAQNLSALQRQTADCLTYCVGEGGGSTLYALVGLNGEDSDGGERLEQAHALAGELRLRCGVSGVWENLTQIQQAKVEAEQALARAAEDGSPSLCREAHQDELGQMVEDFERALSEQRREQALELLDGIESSRGADPSLAKERVKNVLVSAIASMQLEEPERCAQLASITGADAQTGSDWAMLRRVVEQLCAGDGYGEVVEAALEYIHDHFRDNALSLESVAAHCGVSAAHLSRLLKKKTGTGYIDYVTDLRMNEARRLLAENDVPVTEVAQQVGYLNVSSFRKKFKAVTGVGLSEYRRENRREE